MSPGSEIQLERDNANDQEATIVKLYRPSGAAVKAGDSLFDAESSKATQEISAPSDGIFVHDLKEGLKVPYGVSLAKILPPGSNDLFPPSLHATQPPVQPERKAGVAPRFSPAARSLALQHGLGEQDFDSAFVTSTQVKAKLGNGMAQSDLRLPRRPENFTGTPVFPRKRHEIEALSAGAGNSMLSVLGTRVGAVEVERKSGDFFAGKITDLVVFEASRLMHKYSGLNASYWDGAIQRHPSVNAGIAFDEGGRLVVYGLSDSDQKDLATVQLEIEDALSRYVERKLTDAEMTRATFTITDLSAQPLDYIFPLLSSGQSCIIGITRAAEGSFGLYIGFDHRVTEGLEAAKFLQELRVRVLSFAPVRRMEPRCFFCDKSAEDEINRYRGRGLVKVLDHNSEERLCCGACLNGW
jgi:pyruvate/2-oxoglutarate dehydrogenase complex dihydrolipoamide acyltransferase (E2) component